MVHKKSPENKCFQPSLFDWLKAYEIMQATPQERQLMHILGKNLACARAINQLTGLGGYHDK
jgi:hypothetical protein